MLSSRFRSLLVDLPTHDGSQLTKLRRRLRDWYATRARDLPWRRTGDPYRIWISEVMLQQTTVVAVVPYFERFLGRFPTIHELAAAEQAEVLRHWEGLGYYSRARNIHKAAIELVSQRDGVFPPSVEELMSLPGIGRYTAGAIMSFAFDLPAPIVEANTLRLYCRLLGYDDNPRSTAGQRALWAFAEQLVPLKEPGEFNQALMELGALVCTPTEPHCSECPIVFACRAKTTERQHEIPQAALRPEVTHLIDFSIAIRSGSRYLLRKYSDGERWAGLWDFIRLPLPGQADATVRGRLSSGVPEHAFQPSQPLPTKLATQIERDVRQRTHCEVRLTECLIEIKHSVTRYRIRLQCVLAETDAPLVVSPDFQWLSPDEFDDVPFSVTGRKLAKLLQKRVG